MGLVNGSIPSLINGVSQQPASLRLPTQAIEQINATSSLIDGLGKRPPTSHLAKIGNQTYIKPFVHFVNRDEAEKYVMLFYPDHIAVADEEGKTYPVTGNPAAFDYLDNKAPYRYMKALTIADTTIVLNRRYATAMTSKTLAARPPEALVWIRAGTYACDYTIKVENTAATFTTSATDVSTLKTTYIATQLATDLAAALGSGWVVTRYSNAIWIRPLNGKDFKITTADDNGDRNHSVIKGTVSRFDLLPENAPDGFIATVKGAPESEKDDYVVKFVTRNASAFGPGLWAEAGAPGSLFQFDAATMPHQLVRKQDDSDGTVTGTPGGIYFDFSEIRWAFRNAGSDATIPPPSFIGKGISDVFLHRNRLGFLAQASVVLSQSGSLFNFWQQTALTLLDDDPIDINVAHSRAVNFRHAKTFQEELLLFSDHTQFALKGTDILSPKTVSVQVATEYSCHIDTVPVNAENMIYFPFDNGGYTNLREYYVDGQNNQQKNAKSITEHCPRYLLGSAHRLTVSPTDNYLFAITDGVRDRMYVYKWFWNGQDKVQSSWSTWSFGNGQVLLAAGFLGDVLHLVSVYSDGTYLESVRLDPGATDDYSSWTTHVDRRVNEATPGLTMSYDDKADTTTIKPPYPMQQADDWVVVSRSSANDQYVAGRVLTQVSADDQRITVRGDCRPGFWLGRKYAMEYTFSPPMLRTQSPLGGVDIVTEGRLQLLDFTVKYARTGYFRAEVTPDYRDTTAYPMTGQTLKTPSLLVPGGLGKVQLRDGILKFAVMSRNDQCVVKIVNDSHLPSYFSAAEWRAQYTPKAQRL